MISRGPGVSQYRLARTKATAHLLTLPPYASTAPRRCIGSRLRRCGARDSAGSFGIYAEESEDVAEDEEIIAERADA